MKSTLIVTAVLFLFALPQNLNAQSPKTAEETSVPSLVPGSATTTPIVAPSPLALKYPPKEDKKLVDVQESKVKLPAQKKSVPEKKSQQAPSTILESTADPVIVTATRNAQPLSQIGLPVSVITREQIEQQSVLQTTDILRSVPGLAVVRSGPRGRTTSLFLRGANANQTLFMIDGVQYVSPTTGSFDITNILLEDVDRIEVIKGPQSTLYGSEAMGGVVNIITRKGKLGWPKVEGRFEYGSQYSFYESGTVSGAVGPMDYFASLGRLDSDVGTAKRRIEQDPYRDMNVSGRVGVKLPFDSRLDTNYRFMSGFTPIDDGAFLNDVNRWSKTKDNVIGTALTLNPFNWLTQAIKFSYFDERLLSVDPANPGLRRPERESVFKLDAQIYTFDWQNTIQPFETNTITGGYELQIQRGDNRTFDRIIRNGGYYIQDQQSFWDRLFLTAGVRLEDNNSFGTSLNPKVSAAYLLKETKTKFKGSFGTGFRTPTLNELYFPNFGNPNLLPEESRSFDWGIEQELPFFNSKAGVDMYISSYDNLIQSVPNPLTPGRSIAMNTGKAVMEGFEVNLGCEPIKDIFTLQGFYAYLITKDKNRAGGELIRRPKNSGGINANLHFLKRWNFNIDANIIGSRDDRSFAARRPPFELSKGFCLLDLMLSYDLMDHWQIYGRGENVTNSDYEEALGFATPGALFYGGVKMKY